VQKVRTPNQDRPMYSLYCSSLHIILLPFASSTSLHFVALHYPPRLTLYSFYCPLLKLASLLLCFALPFTHSLLCTSRWSKPFPIAPSSCTWRFMRVVLSLRGWSFHLFLGQVRFIRPVVLYWCTWHFQYNRKQRRKTTGKKTSRCLRILVFHYWLIRTV